MKNKLPIKYEDGFFSKIKKFFSNVFKKKLHPATGAVFAFCVVGEGQDPPLPYLFYL